MKQSIQHQRGATGGGARKITAQHFQTAARVTVKQERRGSSSHLSVCV